MIYIKETVYIEHNHLIIIIIIGSYVMEAV